MPTARRIKSQHDLGDVLMDFTDKSVAANIPDEIKQVLMDMTLGGTDQLHLWEVEKCAEILERIKTACAPKDGKISYDQCEEGVDLLMSLMKAKNDNQAEMVYTHLPEQLQAVFKCWDVDGNGSVSATELHAAAGAWTKMHEEKTLLKRMLFGALLVMLVMFVGIFVLGMVTSELSKEFKATNSGSMVDSTGKTVRVANAGFDVASDGKIVAVSNGTEATTVSVEKSRNEKSLHSALADKYFDAIDEVTVHSEKGHKLNLKIMGFARVPLLGARCGSVVLLFPAVDGHLTLDSTDISLNGNLASQFKNAGFEIAVGGAGGRRLEGVKSAHGFFDHVESAAAGWKCEGVPLPKTPKTSSFSSIKYSPCAQSTQSCDSVYGGSIVGTTVIPSQHVSAVSSRLDNIRRDLKDEKAMAGKLLFGQVTLVVMKSPSYEVQFTMFKNHPKQEQVHLLDRKSASAVAFQRMPSGNNARSFCEQVQTTDAMDSGKSGVNASLHMEFMGVAGEEDGKMYRHWRVMPAEAFRKWILAGEGDKGKEYFEYWDDAATFAPHRLLDTNGDLTVYGPWKDGVSDADVEAELTNAKTVCGDDEKDDFHPVFGTVPHVVSSSTDPSLSDLDFYVKEVAEDVNAQNNAENATTTLEEAWGTMTALPASDDWGSFAAYAVRSKDLFAMPDACAAVCAQTLADVRNVAGTNGAGALCNSPQLKSLQECFSNLAQPLANMCVQSHFNMKTMARCNVEADVPEVPEEAEGGRVLADGTQAIGLDSFGDRQRVSELVPEAAQDDARLLVNASAADTTGVVDVPGRGRRLAFVEWCGTFVFPICITIGWPNSCKPDGGSVKSFDYATRIVTSSKDFWKNVKKAKSALKNLKRAKKFKDALKTTPCKIYLIALISVPFDGYFTISVSLMGEFNALSMFSIPNPPIYGFLFFAGGVTFSSKPACPGKIKFTFDGYLKIGFRLGLNLLPGLLPRIDVFTLTLEGGASTRETKKYHVDREVSRRRSPCAGCRRRGWGDWSRRRGNQWQRTWYDGHCDLVFYVKITLTLLIVRGWVMYEYFCANGAGRVTLGLEYYEIWKLWWGNWVSIFTKTVYRHD